MLLKSWLSDGLLEDLFSGLSYFYQNGVCHIGLLGSSWLLTTLNFCAIAKISKWSARELLCIRSPSSDPFSLSNPRQVKISQLYIFWIY